MIETLKEILKVMKESGEFSSANIAKKLNISELMVEMYKEQLEKKGFINKTTISGCSTEKCSNCGCGCSNNLSPLSGWEITKKGLNLID